MPIKFRCQHCKQLLGISHTKAGGIVDCPSCGRSIRVPEIDGRVEPIPEPSIIKDDSELAEAFDELANLNEPVKIKSEEPVVSGTSRSDSAVIAPAPVAKSVSLPPVPAPKPVSTEPSGKKRISHQTESVKQELEELAKSLPAPDAQTSVSVSSNDNEKKNLSVPVWIGLIVFASLVSFMLGYFFSGVKQPIDAGSSSAEKKKSVELEAGAGTPTENWSRAITGRITYRSETGDSRPDRGARVIVFPDQRQGSARLSAVGLRPGDSDIDFNMSKTGLQLAGANVTRVDDEGKFELKLPTAGNYQILVVSRFVSQNFGEQTDSKMEKTLGEFFLKPAEVTGKLATVFGPVNYNGNEPIQWDHAFEAK